MCFIHFSLMLASCSLRFKDHDQNWDQNNKKTQLFSIVFILIKSNVQYQLDKSEIQIAFLLYFEINFLLFY
jgi:hypothetical protein